MSLKVYEKAIKKIKKCDEFDCGTPHSEKVIEKAESLLNIAFSTQIKNYLSKFGYIEVFGVELYGIVDEDFSMDKNTYEGCMVEWTLDARAANNLNPDWVALKFEDDGEMVFLDFENTNEEGEPRVIAAIDEGNGYVFEDELAEDFGKYLIYLIEEEY
ncbi:SMI1/KNR4 family protein [Porcipelethomonas sp.]|uniref:SMI1/KNR4 family protein n=1 Tax=Porcipelethomonas sp. TaxID=2981675 RepID=UPI003EF4BA01